MSNKKDVIINIGCTDIGKEPKYNFNIYNSFLFPFLFFFVF